MCEVGNDGYANVSYEPKRFDVYLVETKEGCVDFALFDINGWHKGETTGGTPLYWCEIPKREK